jgi:hypothetical protein
LLLESHYDFNIACYVYDGLRDVRHEWREYERLVAVLWGGGFGILCHHEEKMKNLFCIIGLLALMGSAFASIDLGEDYYLAHSNWQNQLKLAFQPMTMVGGYTCSNQPESHGSCTVGTDCNLPCPSWINGGCAIQIYDSSYALLQEIAYTSPDPTYVFNPTPALPKGTRIIYEVYYCNTLCLCSDWQKEGVCGGGGCAADKVHETRTCNFGCQESTTGCVYSPICKVTTTSGITTTTGGGSSSGGVGVDLPWALIGGGALLLIGVAMFAKK